MQAIHTFLSNEDRAGNIVLGALSGIGAVAFVIAVAAILLMR